MDELHFSMVRLFVSILSVIGIVWYGLRYLIKYKVYRQGVELREESRIEISRLEQRVHDAEGDIYDLGIRMHTTEHNLQNHLNDHDKNQ